MNQIPTSNDIFTSILLRADLTFVYYLNIVKIDKEFPNPARWKIMDKYISIYDYTNINTNIHMQTCRQRDGEECVDHNYPD